MEYNIYFSKHCVELNSTKESNKDTLVSEFFNTFNSFDEFIKYFAKTCIILPNEIKYIEDENN